MEQAEAITVFSAINLDDKVIESIRKNKKVVAKLSNIIQIAGGKAEKSQGNLLYALSTKLPPTQDLYTPSFVAQIMNNNWKKVMQLEEAINFLKDRLKVVGDKYEINQSEFESASGVGINVTEADCHQMVDAAFEEHAAAIAEKKWDF
jgi:hypothetical protein